MSLGLFRLVLEHRVLWIMSQQESEPFIMCIFNGAGKQGQNRKAVSESCRHFEGGWDIIRGSHGLSVFLLIWN